MSVAEKLVTVAENVPKVYEAGQKAEYDKFWDTIQDYGNRTDYSYIFYLWNCDYICPKYKMVPTHSNSGNQTFCKSKIKKVEAKYFDFSQKPRGTASNTSWYYTFSTCAAEEIEDIGMQADYAYSYTFAWCGKLKTIAVLRSDENTAWNSAFVSCNALENLTIEGTVGKSGFNVSWSTKLTVESLLSILTALSKDSTVASGKSITFATEHQPVIEGDAECLEQLNLAVNAGWTVAYA